MKVLKIASYDFKRLVFNPITLVGFLVVLVAITITGFVYKLPTTPVYSATFEGPTTREIFTSFDNGKTNQTYDTKADLDILIDEASAYLTIQDTCFDFDDINAINTKFKSIKDQVLIYDYLGSCSYTDNGSIAEITSSVDNLKSFVARYKTLDEFESNIIFKNEDFSSLESCAVTFDSIITNSTTIEETLIQLNENIDVFEKLNQSISNVLVWNVIDSAQINTIKTNYIEKAQSKNEKIYAEMQKLYTEVPSSNISHLDEMKSLITNYKHTCEIAKNAVKYELKLLLNHHYKSIGGVENLYNYQSFSQEQLTENLALFNFYLNEEELHFSQHQTPLNFNQASYEVTMYDHAYFVSAIIGFLVVILAIFFAYKLFGRDRKNGKIDLILAQNVSFGQVFAGKFLAIVFATSFFIFGFALLSLIWGALLYAGLPNGILAVFNATSAYTISPFLFFLIKLIGLELQAIFYAVITIFLMNISRKFNLTFIIAICIFAAATVCNCLFNNALVYTLFPFIHADITSFLGGGTVNGGFLVTAMYSSGNFFISLAYYLVVVGLLYNFTKQLFKKN